jgi:hypothetical protein
MATQPAQRIRNAFVGQFTNALLNRETIRHLYRTSAASMR